MDRSRKERRKFRKRWREAAKRATPELRGTVGVGQHPTHAQMNARRRVAGLNRTGVSRQ